MTLEVLSQYVPWQPKALVTVGEEKIIVTIVGMTNQSIITDNGTMHDIKNTKLYLHDLKESVHLMVEDDEFGECEIIDLISMTKADYERFTYAFEHDNLVYSMLYHWQLKRLAEHHVDFAGMVPKSEALDIDKMHNEH